ncbi:MAG: hypothetical protein HQ582_19805 [Planctomycetes bacterium]|nr:hypothetical protein [Planctomycetota bacterium]
MRIYLLVVGFVLYLVTGSLLAQKLEARLDEFGNPVGKGFGLAADGEFQGRRLLAWTETASSDCTIFARDNPLWAALKAKGFQIQIQGGPFDPSWLRDADQLWLFACMDHTDERAYKAVVEFVNRGKGLYLIADNEPWVVEAAELARRLFGADVVGNYMGNQIIAVRGRGMTRDDLRASQRMSARQPGSRRRRGSNTQSPPNLPLGGGRIDVINRTSHYVDDHALLTGINFLYEGITISHIIPSDGLHIVLTASDGQALAAVARDRKKRVVVDCGFTRYYAEHVTKTAGTIRYAENIAAYLMGKDEKALTDVTKLRGNVPGLLKGLQAARKPTERNALTKELDKTKPRYSEVKDHIEEIWELTRSDNEQVAAAAREQIVNAFKRAPISHCLYWIGQGDDELAKLIWEQIDARVTRASAERRAEYAKSAVTVLEHSGVNMAGRKAAIRLLTQLNDGQVIENVVELLSELPSDLAPDAGQLLRDLTGQDFGPRSGDQIGNVLQARRQWQAWLQANAHK